MKYGADIRYRLPYPKLSDDSIVRVHQVAPIVQERTTHVGTRPTNGTISSFLAFRCLDPPIEGLIIPYVIDLTAR